MNHQLNESQLVRAVSDLIGGGGTLILPDISKHDASRYSEMLSRKQAWFSNRTSYTKIYIIRNINCLCF